MKPLIILGTGRFAEDVADLACETPGVELRGFVEFSDPRRCGQPFFEGLPVYWKDALAELATDHWAVCAMGRVLERRPIVEMAAAGGMRFATIIHPRARVSSRLIAPGECGEWVAGGVGEGSIISAGVCVGARAAIGRHVILNRGALIGHHTRIGDFTTIGPGANIAGNSRIGRGVYVGAGAVILDNLKVGDGSVVGAGSVVIHDVPDHVEVIGAPARITKTEVEGR